MQKLNLPIIKSNCLFVKLMDLKNFNNLTDMIYMTCSRYTLNLPYGGLPIATIIKANEQFLQICFHEDSLLSKLLL